MRSNKISLVFFGSGPVAAASLKELLHFFNLELVITKPRPAHHKGRAAVEDLATQNNLPLAFARNKEEVDKALEDSQPLKSTVGLVIDFGVIVSEQTINYFKKGLINSHFSLLPRWRGADPITYCLLEGDKETGVSLMRIVPKLDDGPLIAQESFTLPNKINSINLTKKLVSLSDSMLKTYMPSYLEGKIKPYPQSHTNISYSYKISKADGIIDWHKPAERIEREIRAYAEWPKSRTGVNDIDCIIVDADVVDGQGEPGDYLATDKSLMFYTGKKSLAIKHIKPAGKKEMSIEEFLRGYRSKL